MSHAWILKKKHRYLSNVEEYKCKNCGIIGLKYPDEIHVSFWRPGSCGEIVVEDVLK